nr:PC4/YdbC family ssDNA-binding protein [Mycoplasmopsis bovis]
MAKAKYDIRDWNNDHSRSSKGITLTLEELKKFKRFTNNLNWLINKTINNFRLSFLAKEYFVFLIKQGELMLKLQKATDKDLKNIYSFLDTDRLLNFFFIGAYKNIWLKTSEFYACIY